MKLHPITSSTFKSAVVILIGIALATQIGSIQSLAAIMLLVGYSIQSLKVVSSNRTLLWSVIDLVESILFLIYAIAYMIFDKYDSYWTTVIILTTTCTLYTTFYENARAQNSLSILEKDAKFNYDEGQKEKS